MIKSLKSEWGERGEERFQAEQRIYANTLMRKLGTTEELKENHLLKGRMKQGDS